MTSTPLPFFQELLKSFGFQEVQDYVHYDFGEKFPSPTYILDVRGKRLAAYLKSFASSANLDDPMQVLLSSYSFTSREQEIIKLIMDDCSNAEISKTLYIAEITVKKHISRILKKVGVKNRSQLIKKLMEEIYQ